MKVCLVWIKCIAIFIWMVAGEETCLGSVVFPDLEETVQIKGEGNVTIRRAESQFGDPTLLLAEHPIKLFISRESLICEVSYPDQSTERFEITENLQLRISKPGNIPVRSAGGPNVNKPSYAGSVRFSEPGFSGGPGSSATRLPDYANA